MSHQSVCLLLLKEGANVDIQNNNGTTPLYAAVKSGHESICELLLQYGASPDLERIDGPP